MVTGVIRLKIVMSPSWLFILGSVTTIGILVVRLYLSGDLTFTWSDDSDFNIWRWVDISGSAIGWYIIIKIIDRRWELKRR
jgi:hypothetical protein